MDHLRQIERDAEGFQLVRRGRRARKSLLREREHLDCAAPGVGVIIASVLRTKDDQSMIHFASFVVELLKNVMCEELVCYGLGLFGNCRIARYQLALLIHIASAMKVDRVYVYDPLFRSEEKKALNELGYQCIFKNELCQRTVVVGTVFYMPHCGQAMYNNLLWANWSPQHLMKMTVIGNSFKSYWERCPKKQIDSLIFDALDFCHEQTLPPFTDDDTIFNDMSVHTFPMDKLNSVPCSLWKLRSPPFCDPSDPEIISTDTTSSYLPSFSS